MPTTKLTNEILSAAIAGFETQKLRIDSQIAELRRMLSGERAEAVPETKKGKRTMSAAARQRIGAAQRKRWAAARKQSAGPSKAVAPETAKPKRRLSAAGRKRIIEATKRRWALIRAQASQKAAAS